jgi:hypothetical protein
MKPEAAIDDVLVISESTEEGGSPTTHAKVDVMCFHPFVSEESNLLRPEVRQGKKFSK